MPKLIIKKNNYSDERINTQIYKNSFKTLVILMILLFGNIFISIIFTKNTTQCISSFIILIIASCYFTFMNVKNGIFNAIGSMQIKNGNPRLIALKYSLKASVIKLILDILYNLLKIDKILSYKFIIIDSLLFFVFFYILSYILINVGTDSNITTNDDTNY